MCWKSSVYNKQTNVKLLFPYSNPLSCDVSSTLSVALFCLIMGKERGSERVDNSLTIVCWMKNTQSKFVALASSSYLCTIRRMGTTPIHAFQNRERTNDRHFRLPREDSQIHDIGLQTQFLGDCHLRAYLI